MLYYSTLLAISILVISTPALGANHFSGLTVSNSIGGSSSYACRTQGQVTGNITYESAALLKRHSRSGTKLPMTPKLRVSNRFVS